LSPKVRRETVALVALDCQYMASGGGATELYVIHPLDSVASECIDSYPPMTYT
jgi:hypothetical protein